MLSSEQISFFKANGYLLLPGVMDLELCARVRDAMWQSLPKDSPMRQDDPRHTSGHLPRRNSLTTVCIREWGIAG